MVGICSPLMLWTGIGAQMGWLKHFQLNGTEVGATISLSYCYCASHFLHGSVLDTFSDWCNDRSVNLCLPGFRFVVHQQPIYENHRSNSAITNITLLSFAFAIPHGTVFLLLTTMGTCTSNSDHTLMPTCPQLQQTLLGSTAALWNQSALY